MWTHVRETPELSFVCVWTLQPHVLNADVVHAGASNRSWNLLPWVSTLLQHVHWVSLLLNPTKFPSRSSQTWRVAPKCWWSTLSDAPWFCSGDPSTHLLWSDHRHHVSEMGSEEVRRHRSLSDLQHHSVQVQVTDWPSEWPRCVVPFNLQQVLLGTSHRKMFSLCFCHKTLVCVVTYSVESVSSMQNHSECFSTDVEIISVTVLWASTSLSLTSFRPWGHSVCVLNCASMNTCNLQMLILRWRQSNLETCSRGSSFHWRTKVLVFL